MDFPRFSASGNWGISLLSYTIPFRKAGDRVDPSWGNRSPLFFLILVVALSAGRGRANAQDPVATDRAALVALYESTDGPNWVDSTNWLSSEPLSAWHGIETDSDGRVIVLNLADNQLTGEIPLDISDLSSLETLDLRGNDVCQPASRDYENWVKELTHVLGHCVSRAESVINVALFYTPSVRLAQGSAAVVEALIDLLIAETNQAYAESGVRMRLSLAAAHEVSYVEADSHGADLRNFQVGDDGMMDEVHAIRSSVGADIMHLLVDLTDGGTQFLPVCGLAYLLPFNGLYRSEFAFGLSDHLCGTLAFAHELGHNMGLEHDRYASFPSKGRFPYGFGYVNQRAFEDGAPMSARWRTIMAYSLQCEEASLTIPDFNCRAVLRFSNPRQTYDGDPLGVFGEEQPLDETRVAWASGPSDAVRTLNNGRVFVEQFRTVPTATPVTASFDAATYEATEGGSSTTVTVHLSGAPDLEVVIPLVATHGYGAFESDYTGVPASLTFAGDETSRTFDVSAVDDTDSDDGETVELGFGTLPPGITLGDPSTATVRIADNGDTQAGDTTRPAVLITSDATFPTNSEFAVTVSFSEDVSGFVAADLEAINGTKSNFLGSGTTFTFDVEPSVSIEDYITIQVGADAAYDAARNGNEAGTASFAVDTLAPALRDTGLIGSAFLRLIFNEALDWKSSPVASDFEVRSGDQHLNAERVAILGSEVRIRLNTKPTYGQTVTVTYRAQSSSPVRDLAGNEAQMIAELPVTRTLPVSEVDMNGDGLFDAIDFLVMYYASKFEDQLSDEAPNGEANRHMLLKHLAGRSSLTEEQTDGMWHKAIAWQKSPNSDYADLSQDDEFDWDDALISYYALQLEDVLGDGESGGFARFRQALLGALTGGSDPSDEDLKDILRTAHEVSSAAR